MSFLTSLNHNPLIFDGAMGTMIYEQGVFINACYDDLSTTQPDLIRAIHRDYVAAGADVIETNTFGANRIRLAEYGLADKIAAINTQAVILARHEAGSDVFVAGSCGPCTRASDTIRPTTEAIAAAFEEQCHLLAEAGCDLICLETFHNVDELLLAAAAARKCGLPVLASISPVAFQGQYAEDILRRIDTAETIDIVGLNCHFGPAEMLLSAQHARAIVRKPLVIMPNAGGPREIGGRSLYLNNPEYFTEYAKKYIELGVNEVGGCCGTTPAHIRMAARAINVLSGVKSHIEIRNCVTTERTGNAKKPTSEALTPVPFAEKSPFSAKLAAGTPVTSVEILPPRNPTGLEAFIAKCRVCQEAGVDAINLPDGPRASARMSVLATAFAMRQAELTIEPIPHLCCRDRNLIGLQSDLIGAVGLGLHNWLIITGDPPKLGNYPEATGVFDVDAIGLTQLCSNLNRGIDAAAQPLGEKLPFTIGVGVNPAAIEPEREIARYVAKIEAGAEFAITQPVFDVDALMRFLDRLSKHSTSIPLIIGLYPLLSARNAIFMNEHVPGIHVPSTLISRLQACDTKETAAATGVAIARELRDAITKSTRAIAGFQISAPLGRTDIALQTLS